MTESGSASKARQPRPATTKSSWRGSVQLASKLFGSTVLAQIAVMAATAYAATNLSPLDFAWYGAVSGTVWVAASFNTLAADQRIGIVSKSLCISLLRGAAVSVAVVSLLCVASGAVGLATGAAWAPIALLVASAALGLGIQQLLIAILLRDLRQEILARGRLVQGITNATLIVLFVLTPMPGYLALSLSWILSIFVGLVPLARGATLDLRAIGRPRINDVRVVIREVKLLPLSQLMAGSVASLPLIVLPAVSDGSVGGAWALVSRFLTPVVNTAYSTLQPLYYGRAAELLRDRKHVAFKQWHGRWLGLLCVASMPVSLLFVVCIEWFVPLLGSKWEVASLVLLPSCLFFTSSFIGLPVSQTLVLLGRVTAQFWWTAIRFILCVTPFLFVDWLGPDLALLAWAVAAALTFMGQLVMHRIAIGAQRPTVESAQAPRASKT